MKIQLSDRDRAIAAVALRSIPWGGGEERMVALHELTQALNVDQLRKRYPKTELAEVPATPSQVVLGADQVEMLIEILCGAGQGLTAAFGELAAELVVRLRRQKPPKKTEQQEKANERVH